MSCRPCVPVCVPTCPSDRRCVPWAARGAGNSTSGIFVDYGAKPADKWPAQQRPRPVKQNSTGICVCRQGLFDCDGSCIDRNSSNSNCGACGNVCPKSSSCVDGACVLPCNSSTCPDGKCVENKCVTTNPPPLPCNKNTCPWGVCLSNGRCVVLEPRDCNSMTCAYGKCKNGVCVDEVSDDGKEEQEDNGTVDAYGDLKPAGQEEHA